MREPAILACSALIALLAAVQNAPQKPPARPTELGMTPAIACLKVDGYDDFVELPDASLTPDDKLQVYYKPLNYAVEKRPKFLYSHLTQDVRIRRKGKKDVLWKKDQMFNYEAKSPDPTQRIFMTNKISIKALTPGEYELDIILHDALVAGSAATQTLAFTVVPIPKSTEPAGSGDPAGSKPRNAPRTKGKSGP
jgi:hypothetical protein